MNDVSTRIESLREKLGRDLCILGHHYQKDGIIAHCDHTGDSLELSRRVSEIAARHIVFCGVFFMGESAAILTRPGQNVYLPREDADCMMSLMASACHARAVLKELAELGRDVTPLAYVNTSVGLKAVVGAFGGAVCTSANAKTLLKWAFDRGRGVLFLPDRHLGRNAARALGMDENDWHVLRLSGDGLLDPATQPLDRPLLLWPGCCPIHGQFTQARVASLRREHKNCRIIAHPECPPEVAALCDDTGSTAYIIKDAAAFAEAARNAAGPRRTLVVGTECNLVDRLTARHRADCDIIPFAPAFCPDMGLVDETALLALLEKIAAGSARPVNVPEAEGAPARLALTRMLDACGK